MTMMGKVVEMNSDCLGCGGRAVAVPPFSGPRSRSTAEDREGQPHLHRGALDPWGQPRMGPAPGDTTTTLQAPTVAWHANARSDGSMVGGSGVRAQAPFAVAPTDLGHDGVNAAVPRGL